VYHTTKVPLPNYVSALPSVPSHQTLIASFSDLLPKTTDAPTSHICQILLYIYNFTLDRKARILRNAHSAPLTLTLTFPVRAPPSTFSSTHILGQTHLLPSLGGPVAPRIQPSWWTDKGGKIGHPHHPTSHHCSCFWTLHRFPGVFTVWGTQKARGGCQIPHQ